MNNELTNLLPPERLRAIRRDYFMRLNVVVAIFLILLSAVAATLLIPTYLFLTESVAAENAHLAGIELTTSSPNGGLSARLTRLSNEAKILTALAAAPSVSDTLRAIFAVVHPGITLSSFSYSSAAKGGKKTVAVSGIAATRDVLRAYQLALQNSPFASAADLPVSAYASDSNIAFTITITLAP